MSNNTGSNRSKTVAVVGAAVGFFLFLVIALLPALVYGGYAGLLLAGGIFGTPVPGTLLARGLVAFGMVLAVMASASVFTVAGAAAASFLAHLAHLTPKVEAEHKPVPAHAHK